MTDSEEDREQEELRRACEASRLAVEAHKTTAAQEEAELERVMALSRQVQRQQDQEDEALQAALRVSAQEAAATAGKREGPVTAARPRSKLAEALQYSIMTATPGCLTDWPDGGDEDLAASTAASWAEAELAEAEPVAEATAEATMFQVGAAQHQRISACSTVDTNDDRAAEVPEGPPLPPPDEPPPEDSMCSAGAPLWASREVAGGAPPTATLVTGGSPNATSMAAAVAEGFFVLSADVEDSVLVSEARWRNAQDFSGWGVLTSEEEVLSPLGVTVSKTLSPADESGWTLVR